MARREEAVAQIARRCLDEKAFWVPGVAKLLPIIAYALYRFRHRTGGTIFRLRHELRQLSEGQFAEPLNLLEETPRQVFASACNVSVENWPNSASSAELPNSSWPSNQ